MARLIVCLFFFSLVSVNTGAELSKEDNRPAEPLSIALLHLDIQLADLDANVEQLEAAIKQAANAGADWVMTPELSVTGYRFEPVIGLDWLKREDPYRLRLQELTKQLDITLFLSHIERDGDGLLYNTLFVIKNGEVIGRHKKINTIPVSESWSTPGRNPSIVSVDGINVGLLICADAWPDSHSKKLKAAGAELILSSANWPPGEYGPGDSWEKRNVETGLPLIVNNRTGIETRPSGTRFDMRQGRSVVVQDGERLMNFQSDDSRILFVQWDLNGGGFVDYAEAALVVSGEL